MLRRVYIYLFCMLVIPGLAFAAADTHEAGAEDGGLDIFAGNAATAVFTVALFLVLLVVLGKWAWGPILTGLQKREEHIRKSIEDAEDARTEAEQSLSQYKEQLAQAQQEAKSIIEKGRADAVALSEDLKIKAQEEVKNLRDQAQQDIETAKEQALKELYQDVTGLATDMASKIIGKTLNAEDHRTLLQDSLNQLQKNSNN